MPATDDKDIHIPFQQYALLRAETVLAELIGNGIPEADLRLHFESNFKKVFRTDVNKIASGAYDFEQQHAPLEVHINRDSLYDLLPEGVFHQPLAATSGASLESMLADSRRLKQEEKMARRFFAPFDQQLLLFSTMVEQQEQHWLKNIEAGNFTKDPYAFWGIPANVPKATAITLSAILPWAYLIKGNQQYIAKALEMVLQKPVTVETIVQEFHKVSAAPQAVEEMYLGEDAVIGDSYSDETLVWKFTIGQVSNAEMVDFIPGGKTDLLIAYLNDIFLPVEMNAVFEFDPCESSETMADPILGYGFFL